MSDEAFHCNEIEDPEDASTDIIEGVVGASVSEMLFFSKILLQLANSIIPKIKLTYFII